MTFFSFISSIPSPCHLQAKEITDWIGGLGKFESIQALLVQLGGVVDDLM